MTTASVKGMDGTSVQDFENRPVAITKDRKIAAEARGFMCRFLLLFLTLALASGARAQDAGLLGDWREPGGAAIRVLPCGADICLRLIQLSPQETHKVDGLNPDPDKRTRPLCNLDIGTGFHLTSPNEAEDGQLYDPKSGKTYQGALQSEGDELRLRGYVGIKAFGRTERWTRIPGGLKDTCS